MDDQEESIPQGSQEADRPREGCQLALAGSREVASIGRPTGPRTIAGKRRSRHNAKKHGIFSSVVVMNGESHQDYEALLCGLRDSLGPVGEAENLLVEKLAALSWRHRRLLVAEGAEIRKNQDFLEWDRKHWQLLEAEEQSRKRVKESGALEILSPPKEGLIWQMQNPEILERCLELLGELREGFSDNGFALGDAESILEKIYGERDGEHLHETLKEEFVKWARTAEVPEEEREQEGYATPERCKEYVLEAIDEEIGRLKRFKKEHATMEKRRIEVEKLRHSVPDMPALERLQRYETTLERSFDRTLGQLERLQRMRLGQPVPPPVKLEVSRN